MFVIPQLSFAYRASLVTGPGALILLALLAGLVAHALIAVAFCYACAFLASCVLMVADRGLRWNAGFRFKGLFAVLTSAFIAFVLVTWMVDYLAKSYLSPPMMIIAMGRHACYPDCFAPVPGQNMAVTSITSYYAYAAGSSHLDPLRYLLLATPGALAIAATLRTVHPSMFARGVQVPHPVYPDRVLSDRAYTQVFAGRGTRRRLLIATLICVAIALFVVTPLFMRFLFFMATRV